VKKKEKTFLKIGGEKNFRLGTQALNEKREKGVRKNGLPAFGARKGGKKERRDDASSRRRKRDASAEKKN